MKKQTRRYPLLRVMVGGIMSLLSAVSYGSNTANVTVKVTILSPPSCTINNDRPIEVRFGDVMTTRVNGVNYRMPVNYSLYCTSLKKNELRMQIIGDAIDLGKATNALATNVTGFGIQLQRGSTPFNINDTLDFVYPAKPVLYAVPVKRNGVTLPTRYFVATATMSVDYQ